MQGGKPQRHRRARVNNEQHNPGQKLGFGIENMFGVFDLTSWAGNQRVSPGKILEKEDEKRRRKPQNGSDRHDQDDILSDYIFNPFQANLIPLTIAALEMHQ
jgi:hypothetical protein